MIADETMEEDFSITLDMLAAGERFIARFWDQMPAGIRQEIESLTAAGWMWKDCFTLTHPDDDEVWIFINPITYEKGISLERAWQLKVQSGEAWRCFE